MNFLTLTLELQKRCLDLGQSKRPQERYQEALNYSLPQYPRELWDQAIDGTTLDTIADTREYNLSGISSLVYPNQVRRIWIDDSSGIKRETGRYEVQGASSTLALVLDYTPTASRDITIEYWTPPASMVLDADTNPVDDEWLLAKAMVALLGEADWQIEEPEQAVAQVEYWNARAVNREAQLLGQRYRSSRRPRTTYWRGAVT
jgi:hypothetical protein